MSCKTAMASGVHLIYGAKSNPTHVSGIVLFFFFNLRYGLPDAGNRRRSETEPPLRIPET